MSNYYSNPTANAAIGAVDKELDRVRKKAEWLRELRQQGLLTPEQEAAVCRQYTGIFRKVLRNALDNPCA